MLLLALLLAQPAIDCYNNDKKAYALLLATLSVLLFVIDLACLVFIVSHIDNIDRYIRLY